FELHVATELDTSARAALWSIFEENMYDLYVGSSMGWDPDTKRAEMFDPLSRFIIVRHNQEDHLDQSKSKSASIIAYSMFRFEREERQNVLYCYELQVQREFRRAGLGIRLMQQLVSIGKRWYMENIMLTVLKSNTPAREFYNKLGYDTVSNWRTCLPEIHLVSGSTRHRQNTKNGKMKRSTKSTITKFYRNRCESTFLLMSITLAPLAGGADRIPLTAITRADNIRGKLQGLSLTHLIWRCANRTRCRDILRLSYRRQP
ncbi:acyl-CoA N-acyltransferase, partial [Wolfiporia cocos MD-104 SS10]